MDHPRGPAKRAHTGSPRERAKHPAPKKSRNYDFKTPRPRMPQNRARTPKTRMRICGHGGLTARGARGHDGSRARTVRAAHRPRSGREEEITIMTITAKFPGRCARCARPIRVGEEIEWAKGRPSTHGRCSAAPAASAAPAPAGTNRRADNCGRCGRYLPAGQGRLTRCMGEASGCAKHFDEEGGWHVSCADAAECATQRAAALEAAAAERVRRAAIDAARDAIRATYSGADLIEEVPVGAEELGGRRGMAGSEIWFVDAAGVTYYRTSSYDDFPRAWRTTATREQVLAAYPRGVESR